MCFERERERAILQSQQLTFDVYWLFGGGIKGFIASSNGAADSEGGARE